MMEWLREQVTENIKTHGRGIIGVSGDDDNLPFGYTIGNTNKNVPELLMISKINCEDIVRLLNAVSDKLVEEEDPYEERDLSLGGKFPVKIRAITDEKMVKNKYTIQVGQFFETEDYRVMQVLVCDQDGVYPGDEEIIDWRYDSPLL